MPRENSMSMKRKSASQLPRSPYQGTTLPNGLPVALRPMDHVASVSVGIWVRAGGRYETSGISGVSHFLEHLLFKGTRTRSCEQLKQAIEGIGGSLNGFTAEEFTCYMVKVPAQYLRRALAVLSDMVLHPAFRPRDIDKERERLRQRLEELTKHLAQIDARLRDAQFTGKAPAEVVEQTKQRRTEVQETLAKFSDHLAVLTST